MKTLSLRIPDDLYARLTAQAERQNLSKTEVARKALQTFLAEDHEPQLSRPSAYELTKDLCGSLEGPDDLSTNQEHMKGYGE